MKVAVLADCHVDHGVHQRWASTAWKRATTDIANETFDVCVVAGDLFHTGKPVSEAVMVCVDGLKTMTAAGVQVLVVAGNHEWIRVRSRDAHRPPCSILGELDGVTTVLSADGYQQGDLWVGAVPWPAPGAHATGFAQTDEIARLGDKATNVDGPKLTAGHILVTEAAQWPGSESEMTALKTLTHNVRLKSLDDPDVFGPVAMGHIHNRQLLSDTVSYVGGLEAFSFIDEGRVGGWSEFRYGNGIWTETFREAGVNTFLTVGADDDLSDVAHGTIIRVRVSDEHSHAAFDVSKLEGSGLVFAGYKDERTKRTQTTGPERFATETRVVDHQELVDRWSKAERLTERDDMLLKHAASIDRGWGDCTGHAH